MKGREEVMEEVVVHDGHFWVNVNKEFPQERRRELIKDIDSPEKPENLALVGNELWARIERPHPTRRQKALFAADWQLEVEHLLRPKKLKVRE